MSLSAHNRRRREKALQKDKQNAELLDDLSRQHHFDSMADEELVSYAAENNINLGNSKQRDAILRRIRQSEDTA
jgi:hypothetical protein